MPKHLKQLLATYPQVVEGHLQYIVFGGTTIPFFTNQPRPVITDVDIFCCTSDFMAQVSQFDARRSGFELDYYSPQAMRTKGLPCDRRLEHHLELVETPEGRVVILNEIWGLIGKVHCLARASARTPSQTLQDAHDLSVYWKMAANAFMQDPSKFNLVHDLYCNRFIFPLTLPQFQSLFTMVWKHWNRLGQQENALYCFVNGLVFHLFKEANYNGFHPVFLKLFNFLNTLSPLEAEGACNELIIRLLQTQDQVPFLVESPMRA